MYPFLTIFGQQIPTFSLMGIFGVVIATFVAGFRAKRYDLTRWDLVNIAAIAGIGIVLGSAIMFAIVNIPNISGWWSGAMVAEAGGVGGFAGLFQFLSRLFGGMVFYGGLFGTIIAVFVYCKYMKLSFGSVISIAVPVFPLAHAFMRIGCFLAGCCYGMRVEGTALERFGIAVTRWSTHASAVVPNGVRIPVQLYESAANLVIFAIIWTFTRKERNWKSIVCLYGIMYSVVRFFLELLRGDAVRGIWQFGMSTSQWISVGVFALCAAVLIYERVKISKNVKNNL